MILIIPTAKSWLFCWIKIFHFYGIIRGK